MVAEEEAQRIGLQINLDLGRPAKLGLVNRAESRRRALLQDFADESQSVKRRRELVGGDAPLRRHVFEGSELTDLLGAPIPRIEICSVERPAVVGKTRLEIHGIVRGAHAGPVVRRAAEKAQSASGQVLKRPADDGALIE